MALTCSPARGIAGFHPGLPVCLCLIAVLALLPIRGSHAATAVPPGSIPCLTGSVPAGYGAFTLVKQETLRQTGDAAPTTDGAVAWMELTPPDAYSISNAIVTGPAGFKATLTRGSSGTSTWSETGPAATLLPRLTAGAWNTSFQLGFTNGDSFIGFFPFLLASNVPPVPAIANLAAAQSVDARTAFTLSWNPWVGSGTNDRVHLVLADASGAAAVSAASDCAGATNLAQGGTSFEIPAGRLAANTTYTGYLTFAASLLATQDDSTLVVERGLESRTTVFTLKTTAATSGGSPGTFLTPAVSGTNLVFTLKGTAGDVHRIESTTGFTAWTKELDVTLPAAGTLVVTLPLPADGTPRFYRAIAVSGSPEEPEVGPATLSVVVSAPRELDITVAGTPGATYNVESTTNGVTWTQVGFTVIPADGKPQVVYVTVPAGSDFLMVRAVSRVAAPPVELKAPTLALTVNSPPGAQFTSLRFQLTGGTPRKSYFLQQRDTTPAATWANLPVGISTDANGNGTGTVNVFRGQGVTPTTGVLYRAFIR